LQLNNSVEGGTKTMRKVKEGMKWDKWYGCANQISDKTMLCHPLSDFTDFTAPQLTTAC